MALNKQQLTEKLTKLGQAIANGFEALKSTLTTELEQVRLAIEKAAESGADLTEIGNLVDGLESSLSRGIDEMQKGISEIIPDTPEPPTEPTEPEPPSDPNAPPDEPT